MGIEVATYISGLDENNPAGSDNISEGDDHLKLIKSVLKNTLPNADEAMNGIHTGATEPTPNTAGQLWFDTTANILKMRNELDNAWFDIILTEGGSNIIKVTRLEDVSTVSIRSSSMTTASTFAYTKVSGTSDMLIQANLYGGLWNYGTNQTGQAQVYNSTDAAVIGTAAWDVGGEWNSNAWTSATNNEVRAWTNMVVLESTPLTAGAKSILLRALCSDPSGGGYSTSSSNLTIWEIEQ